VRLDKQDWEVYAHFDASRHYTRNLIATDHVSYTLLLLCWNPGQESPIHDHPCDGCWMEVFQGQIQECRYRASKHNASTLECTQDKTFDEGGIVFIEDSQGLHKVGNPGTRPAVTMHLYSPPFQSCKIWLDETKKPSKSSICHYSEYGRLV
jgi:cysteine dioxygenase